MIPKRIAEVFAYTPPPKKTKTKSKVIKTARIITSEEVRAEVAETEKKKREKEEAKLMKVKMSFSSRKTKSMDGKKIFTYLVKQARKQLEDEEEADDATDMLEDEEEVDDTPEDEEDEEADDATVTDNEEINGEESSSDDNASDTECSDDDDDDNDNSQIELAKIKVEATWRSLALPNNEDDMKGKWYGVIFQKENRRKSNILYVGKLMRRFLSEKDGPIESIEVKCLKPKFGSGTVLEDTPSHLPDDLFIFPIVNVIIAGPLILEPIKGAKFTFSDYEELVKHFNLVSSIDRSEWL